MDRLRRKWQAQAEPTAGGGNLGEFLEVNCHDPDQ
jgi:hypothetical protein